MTGLHPIDSSHVCDGCLGTGCRHIFDRRQGSPTKRKRKAAITDPTTGELVRFPTPRVPPILQFGWPHEKIEHLLVDRPAVIPPRRWAGLDAQRPSPKMQVIRTVLMIGDKALLDDRLIRDVARERVLHGLLSDARAKRT
jgi:hypothetical protein